MACSGPQTRGGTGHSEQVPPTPKINQENALQIYPQASLVGGIFSVEGSLFPNDANLGQGDMELASPSVLFKEGITEKWKACPSPKRRNLNTEIQVILKQSNMTFLKGHNSLATDSKDTVENEMVGKEFKRVIFKRIKKYKKTEQFNNNNKVYKIRNLIKREILKKQILVIKNLLSEIKAEQKALPTDWIKQKQKYFKA